MLSTSHAVNDFLWEKFLKSKLWRRKLEICWFMVKLSPSMQRGEGFHWLERWCAILADQVQFLTCPVPRQLLQGDTRSYCYNPTGFRVLQLVLVWSLEQISQQYIIFKKQAHNLSIPANVLLSQSWDKLYLFVQNGLRLYQILWICV